MDNPLPDDPVDPIVAFQKHIMDTIDFHRETEGLSYAVQIGVLEIVKHRLLEELRIDENEDDEEPDDYVDP